MPTRHLRRMTNLLETSDLNVRIAAGESLALMYEMARDFNKDFTGDSNGLCDLLRDLATDGNKHKAKKDLRQQRSSFRDILKTVEVSYMNYRDKTFRFCQLPGKSRPAISLFVLSYCLESVSFSLLCLAKVVRLMGFCEIYAMQRMFCNPLRVSTNHQAQPHWYNKWK